MQTTLFAIELREENPKNSEWGTFKDSFKAPVHSWFTYPAGFSYKAVEYSIERVGLTKEKSTIYDPFMGSGTTNIVAKTLGYNSVGVEAHPFVHRITKTKLAWDINFQDVNDSLDFLQSQIRQDTPPTDLQGFLQKEFPQLVLKCFLPETLYQLLIIRNSLKQLDTSKEVYELLRTALICVLRDVSIAATGWPYIAPSKIKVTSISKQGWQAYRNLAYKMYGDITEIRTKAWPGKTDHQILLGDSRDTNSHIEDESADHIFTSPPYLNNFDYADRTRLEMYFMAEATNWGDISDKVRTKLMTSATTQISRTDLRYQFLPDFIKQCPRQYLFLDKSVNQLAELRSSKAGKKSYDLLTVGYFNDIYQVIKDNFRVLRDGSRALYILGDSAPYGVHIPTDELIGQIGVEIGFKSYDIEILLERGGKWAKNPQRHSIMLLESVVILNK